MRLSILVGAAILTLFVDICCFFLLIKYDAATLCRTLDNEKVGIEIIFSSAKVRDGQFTASFGGEIIQSNTCQKDQTQCIGIALPLHYRWNRSNILLDFTGTGKVSIRLIPTDETNGGGDSRCN